MNLEQLEAWCLDKVQPARLNGAFGPGDYVLSERDLLGLMRVAFKAGRMDGAANVMRVIEESFSAVEGNRSTPWARSRKS